MEVDEINIEFPELRILAATYQHFISERRNVALMMAGLPDKVSEVLQDKVISFLRRAFRHNLGSVDLLAVKFAMKKTIELSERSIDNKALDLAVSATEGFPFLIQLIGYHIWKQSPTKKRISYEDVVSGIEFAQIDMYSMIFETTIKELSKKDLEFVLAMLKDTDTSRIGDIAERLGVSLSYTSQYKLRLIEKGVIQSADRGEVKFAIPMIREYLEARYGITGN